MESRAYLRMHEFEKARKEAVERGKGEMLFTYVSNFICHISAFPEENAVLGLSLGRHLSTV